MDNKIFYTRFSIITIVSALAIIGSTFIPVMAEHSLIAWVYLLFFSGFVWASFFMGKKAAASENKNDYTRLVITLIFLKLVFCLIIVVSYDELAKPSNNFHVLYFIILYIIYSIFEFRILSKLGYSK